MDKEDVFLIFLLIITNILVLVALILSIVIGDAAKIIVYSIITLLIIVFDCSFIIPAIKEKLIMRTAQKEFEKLNAEGKIKELYEELKMNWGTLMKQEEIYENLKIRDKVCKNKFGKIKNKKLQDDFLNEIVDRSLFLYEKTITIKEVIDEIKDYKFRYREEYAEKLAEYEKMQEILDKYKEE